MARRSPEDRELAWHTIVLVLLLQVGLAIALWRIAPFIPSLR
jgi:hypothetical protein